MIFKKLTIHFPEDSTETEITDIDTGDSNNDATKTCRNSCSGKEFYAIRRKSNDKFVCKCLDKSSTAITAQSKDTTTIESIKCPEETNVYKDLFTADLELKSFLTNDTRSLWTTSGQDADMQQRNNLCNPDRTINIITLYLASLLGLSVANIMDTFVYNPAMNYTFPSFGDSYPPVNEPDFPNLEQAFWTIAEQYTR